MRSSLVIQALAITAIFAAQRATAQIPGMPLEQLDIGPAPALLQVQQTGQPGTAGQERPSVPAATTGAAQTPGTTPLPTPAPEDTLAAGAAPQGRTDASRFARSMPANLLGDQLGIPGIAFGKRGGQGESRGAILAPTVRNNKVGENESPDAGDRAFFGFNFYDHVNQEINRRFGIPLRNINVFRDTLGLEKTILCEDFSLGLRVPLNSTNADGTITGLGDDASTDFGDLTFLAKYVFWRNHETGSLLSTGLAVTLPTGPDDFAGSPVLTSFHSTRLQPFLGYRLNCGNAFAHGFLSIEVPTDSNDVTVLYIDNGIGYYLFRQAEGGGWLTGVAPTVEVHANIPLNHRSAFDIDDPAGTPDVVDVTAGVTLEINHQCTLALGVVAPITRPRPFDVEGLAQLNIRLGRWSKYGRCGQGE